MHAFKTTTDYNNYYQYCYYTQIPWGNLELLTANVEINNQIICVFVVAWPKFVHGLNFIQVIHEILVGTTAKSILAVAHKLPYHTYKLRIHRTNVDFSTEFRSCYIQLTKGLKRL